MPIVYGSTVDNQTRCKHYHTPKDIIAIKFKCCHKYYPCFQCHEECENHEIAVWKKDEWNTPAILCGVCKTELTIEQYLHADKCLYCGSAFNEGCRNHYHLYFD